MNKMTLKEYLEDYLLKIVFETLYMVFISALIALVLGLVIASILYTCKKSKKKKALVTYQIINSIINILRSFPFVILLYFLIPFTRIVMKTLTGVATSTGTNASIVSLVVAATPFFAKIIENSLLEVKDEVIEAVNSLGLTTYQIITKVLIKEALPSIVLGITLSLVSLIGFSAIVSNVGGGGIGAFAQDKGYNNSDNNAMLFSVVTIIILVSLISFCGNRLYKKLK